MKLATVIKYGDKRVTHYFIENISNISVNTLNGLHRQAHFAIYTLMLQRRALYNERYLPTAIILIPRVKA